MTATDVNLHYIISIWHVVFLIQHACAIIVVQRLYTYITTVWQRLTLIFCPALQQILTIKNWIHHRP